MSTTTACNVRGKQSDGLLQKVGPMKATLPMSSLLRPLNNVGLTTNNNNSSNAYSTMSPPMRLISPDHSSGHRSPGAINYYKGIFAQHLKIGLFSALKLFFLSFAVRTIY